MADREYSRKHLRIKPDNPVYADITILQVGQERVTTGKACIRISNLCSGGMKFLSLLDLPAGGLVLFEVCFRLLDQTFRLKGNIVYKNGTGINNNEYGFCFTEADEGLRSSLKKSFNDSVFSVERHLVIFRFN